MDSLVIDASVLVEALCSPSTRGEHARQLVGDFHLYAPEHVYIESAHAIKNLRSHIGHQRSEHAFSALRQIRIHGFRFTEFAAAAWTHRDNLSIYDAGYLAVAGLTGLPLATGDQRFATEAKKWVPVVTL